MTEESSIPQLRRQTRLIALLSSAQRAGIAPLSIGQLHIFAYIANVLSPVWAMPPLEAAVLKLQGGPYYPSLQADLDDLIGRSVILISEIVYISDDQRAGRRLDGRIKLNDDLASSAVGVLKSFADERKLQYFVDELALALATLTPEELNRAVSEDATYGDAQIAFDDVVDFAQFRERNYSAKAASYLGKLASAGVATTAGEKVQLYVTHLRKRLQDAR